MTPTLKWKHIDEFHKHIKLILPFGKYKGRAICDVFDENPYYFLGLVKNKYLSKDIRIGVMFAFYEAEKISDNELQVKAWFGGSVDDSYPKGEFAQMAYENRY